MRGILLRSALLWLSLVTASGWVSSAHATQLELEVIGEPSLQSEITHSSSGELRVTGQLVDEAGLPLAGDVAILHANGEPLPARPCANPAAPESTLIRVPGNGEFCALVNDPGESISIRASAPHFLEVSQKNLKARSRQLRQPRFTRSPQTVDLGTGSAVVVEVVAGGRAPVAGEMLALFLHCGQTLIPLDNTPLTVTRSERFEFVIEPSTKPGNCQFIARATAPQHQAVEAKRNVLLRQVVSLEVFDTEEDSETIAWTVSAFSKGASVNDGLIEARSEGVFLVGTPVNEGRAHVELEKSLSPMEVELSYVASTRSLIPSEALTLNVDAGTRGKKWATLHTLLLTAFGLWLGYAWLRPRSRESRIANEAPPRHALVQTSGKRSGPVRGVVLDAHTAHPLAKVKLSLEAPHVDEHTTLETVETDEEGRFQFERTLDESPLARLKASHASYMGLSSRVEGAHVTVHLTERRRALIRGLIEWTRHQGVPWHRPPGATPGQVEALARSRGRPQEELWAKSVAAEAYGPEPPSEARIEELRGPATTPPRQEPVGTRSPRQ